MEVSGQPGSLTACPLAEEFQVPIFFGRFVGPRSSLDQAEKIIIPALPEDEALVFPSTLWQSGFAQVITRDLSVSHVWKFRL